MGMSVAKILSLYESRGAARYGGEAVTQLEHALQCAQLALAEGAGMPLCALLLRVASCNKTAMLGA